MREVLTHSQMPGRNTYTDAAFLTALGECRSIPVRRMAIRMDSLAMLLRVGASRLMRPQTRSMTSP